MIYPLQQTVPGTGAAITTELRRISPLLFFTGLASQTVINRIKNVSDWLKTGMPFISESRYQSGKVYFSGLSQSSKLNVSSAIASGLVFFDQMTSFQAFFGRDFYQDASYLRIQKSSLPGLVPLFKNSAESIKVALDCRFMNVGQYYSQLIESKFFRIESATDNPPISRITTVTSFYEFTGTSDTPDPIQPNNFEITADG